MVLRPIPDDPIAAVRGLLAKRAGSVPMTSDDARAQSRQEEAEAELDPRGAER